ncbi:Hypothetical predicted protein [Podarcis lilfordi]|uniref:Uncharacterized protein n=1 Tax=Podarcis lilfordi TaxID=74358 RepID=A0AA35JZ43_9SAUR|nr:Hypothetical predicted protein [Podarcis lilfordi]
MLCLCSGICICLLLALQKWLCLFILQPYLPDLHSGGRAEPWLSNPDALLFSKLLFNSGVPFVFYSPFLQFLLEYSSTPRNCMARLLSRVQTHLQTAPLYKFLL